MLCTSRNHEVVHGIPSKDVILAEGDILGIDFACFKDGYCADAARTVAVGVISAPARRLLDVTRQALERAIACCTPEHRLEDIGAAIQGHAAANGYSIVRELVGHGIGQAMHEAPQVPNYGKPGRGLRLRPGLVIAIEPMLNQGGPDVSTLADGWTIVTDDRSLSAHFEHSVAITDDGPVILTAPDRALGLPDPPRRARLIGASADLGSGCIHHREDHHDFQQGSLFRVRGRLDGRAAVRRHAGAWPAGDKAHGEQGHGAPWR